jgi:hypothetical protein
MSEVLDDVMKQIIKGCKAEARRKVAKESIGLKRENRKLKQELSKTKKELSDLRNEQALKLNPLVQKERDLDKRDKEIRLAAAKVLEAWKNIEELRNKKVYALTSYTRAEWHTLKKRNAALGSLRKFSSKKKEN